MHLAIDGYNLIHHTPELEMAESRGEGREALCMALSLYRKKRKHRITLVLDGGAGPGSERTVLHGVPTVFSGWDRPADDVLKAMARREGQGLTVVTDDRELAGACRSFGAEVFGSRRFGERLMREAFAGADNSGRQGDEGWDFTTKKKGPSRRKPKSRRRRDRRWGRL
jgi:predicted RNA-binding protein with PIN domain